MGTVFIVGAAFSLDANRFLDPGDRRFARLYPLVSELTTCFSSGYNFDQGIEAAFQQAEERRDREPRSCLVKWIETADHYLGSRVAAASVSSYSSLIDQFPESTFVSFNYDCLLEQLLYRRRLWTPVDGFGVECEAIIDESYIKAEAPPTKSSVVVLHPHGSLYLYALRADYVADPRGNMTWIRTPKRKRFRFDADALGVHFIPFRAGAAGLGYTPTDDRVIVPMPNKAKALADDFVRLTYERAIAAIGEAETLIAIGYRFAECDRESFDALVRAFLKGGQRMHVVAPDAAPIASRLGRYRIRHLAWFDGTFDAWVASRFHGL